MYYDHLSILDDGLLITVNSDSTLEVPDTLTIGFVDGDGIGVGERRLEHATILDTAIFGESITLFIKDYVNHLVSSIS